MPQCSLRHVSQPGQLNARSGLRFLARKAVTTLEIAKHIRIEAVAGERDLNAFRVLLLRSLLPQSMELLARLRHYFEQWRRLLPDGLPHPRKTIKPRTI